MIIDTDSHTHPFQGSRDYDGMRKYAEAAVKVGLRKVVFTEHTPLDPRFGFDNRHHLNFAEYETYLECAERCRAEFAGVLEIGIGIEADYHPRNLEQVAKFKRDYPLDYVGGSLHLHAAFWKDDVGDEVHPKSWTQPLGCFLWRKAKEKNSATVQNLKSELYWICASITSVMKRQQGSTGPD